MLKNRYIYESMNGKKYIVKAINKTESYFDVELEEESTIFLRVPKRMLRELNEKKK